MLDDLLPSCARGLCLSASSVGGSERSDREPKAAVLFRESRLDFVRLRAPKLIDPNQSITIQAEQIGRAPASACSCCFLPLLPAFRLTPLSRVPAPVSLSLFPRIQTRATVETTTTRYRPTPWPPCPNCPPSLRSVHSLVSALEKGSCSFPSRTAVEICHQDPRSGQSTLLRPARDSPPAGSPTPCGTVFWQNPSKFTLQGTNSYLVHVSTLGPQLMPNR